MAYFKGVLATITTLFLAALIPMFWITFRGLSSEHGTGLAAVAGGLLESIVSPWFWILALLFSAVFYFSGRLDNRTLRVLLFWIPTVTTSALGFGFWALCMLLLVRLRSH
jgi:hypothetical protein